MTFIGHQTSFCDESRYLLLSLSRYSSTNQNYEENFAMNRRFFVHGVGFMLLSLLGMKRNAAAIPAQSNATKKSEKGTPVTGDEDTPEEVRKRAQAVAIFMLGATQSLPAGGNRQSHILRMFDNPEKNHFIDLGFTPEVLKDFIKRATDKNIANNIKQQCDALSKTFFTLYNYGKPDCPNTKTLKQFVDVANKATPKV